MSYDRRVTTTTLTSKGAATRARIVEATADMLLAHGIGATSLDDIRAETKVSKSQLFHYFPEGKRDLIAAVAAFQGERVLQAQRPHLDELDTWASWGRWRNAVVAHYASQQHWGCPIGSLASQLLGNDPERAAQVGETLDRWRGCLSAGLERMRATGRLRTDADPERLGLAVFAALQGGLLLTATMQSVAPLEAALDQAIRGLHTWSPTQR